jgi:hypothetical protein
MIIGAVTARAFRCHPDDDDRGIPGVGILVADPGSAGPAQVVDECARLQTRMWLELCRAWMPPHIGPCLDVTSKSTSPEAGAALHKMMSVKLSAQFGSVVNGIVH